VCNGKGLNDTLDIPKNNVERKSLGKYTPNVGVSLAQQDTPHQDPACRDSKNAMASKCSASAPG